MHHIEGKNASYLLTIFLAVAMPTVHACYKTIMRTVEVQNTVITIQYRSPEAVFSGCVCVAAVRPNAILLTVLVDAANATDRFTCGRINRCAVTCG